MDAPVGSGASPKSNAGGLEVTVSRYVALRRIEPSEPGSMAVLAGQPRGPVRPPNKKVIRKPIENSIGVSKVNWPFHMVPIQLKNLIPVGMAIKYVMKEKNGSRTAPVANI